MSVPVTCPDGHESDAADYCSVCGLAIAASGGGQPSGLTAVESAPAAVTGSLACPHCSETHGRDDVFCENCGYDFITGSLPAVEAAVTSGAPPTPAPGGPPVAVLATLSLTVDPAFHARMDADGVLTLPDPLPEPTTVEVTSSPVLVGRASPSRNIHPDIEISGDPAASGRHARLDRRPDGVWTVTDLGSTNGTYVGAGYTRLNPNQSHVLTPGASVYVGAWTRIDVNPTA